MIRNSSESVLYRLMEWTMRLAYLNFLWLIFTLLGGIVFGWVPATITMHMILRKWIIEDESFDTKSYFWSIYRKQFIGSQKVSVFFITLGILLIFDLKFFMSGYSTVFTLGKLFTIQLVIGYFILFIYFFTLFAHSEMSFFKMVKTSILFGIKYPFKTLILLLSSTLLVILFLSFPKLFIIFGASSLAFLNIYCSHKMIYKKKNLVSLNSY